MKIIATLIAAFFAVTALAADTAPVTSNQAPAAQSQTATAPAAKKTEVQKSKKKKKTHKHGTKTKKDAATPVNQ